MALFLHQIEQTLQESFGLLLAEVVAPDEQQAKVATTDAPLSSEAEATVAHLTKQMKHNENSYRAEVEKNKVELSIILSLLLLMMLLL